MISADHEPQIISDIVELFFQTYKLLMWVWMWELQHLKMAWLIWIVCILKTWYFLKKYSRLKSTVTCDGCLPPTFLGLTGVCRPPWMQTLPWMQSPRCRPLSIPCRHTHLDADHPQMLVMWLVMHAWKPTPLWTDRCKNITFPQLRLWVVIIF